MIGLVIAIMFSLISGWSITVFFAKTAKIITVVCMKLHNVFFMLLLIAFPHSSFANARIGSDFSEDYFKKFGIDKVFKCKDLSRNNVEQKINKYIKGNLRWWLNPNTRICQRNISFLKDAKGEDYINLASGIGDGDGNKYNKKANSRWNDFKFLERRRFEIGSEYFDFSNKAFTFEYEIRIPSKHKFIDENASLTVGQLHTKKNNDATRFFLMKSGYWVMGVKAVKPEDYNKWNKIKVVVNNYDKDYGVVVIVNGKILRNKLVNNESLKRAEKTNDTVHWSIGLYQQKIYKNFYNPAEQSVDLKNIRSSVHRNYIEPNPLMEAFNSLSKDQRKNVQINLEGEGFYSSTIDGYYGKNTEKGLKKYNSSFLDASDLEKSINIDVLLTKLSKVVNPQED